METERIDDEREEVFICTWYERAINYVHDSNTQMFSQFETNKHFLNFFLSVFYYIISKFNKLMTKKRLCNKEYIAQKMSKKSVSNSS